MKGYSRAEYQDILIRELFGDENILKDGTFSDLIAELSVIKAYEKLLFTLVAQSVNNQIGPIKVEVEEMIESVLVEARKLVDKIIDEKTRMI